MFKNIDYLVDKMYISITQNKDLLQDDIALYKKELKETTQKIDNILNAIADGMYNASMKAKLTELENKKAELLISLNIVEQPIRVTRKQIKSYLSTIKKS